MLDRRRLELIYNTHFQRIRPAAIHLARMPAAGQYHANQVVPHGLDMIYPTNRIEAVNSVHEL